MADEYWGTYWKAQNKAAIVWDESSSFEPEGSFRLPVRPQPGWYPKLAMLFPAILEDQPEFLHFQQSIASLPQELQDAILIELLRLCLNPGTIEIDLKGLPVWTVCRRTYNFDPRVRLNRDVHPKLDVSIFKALNRKWAACAFSILYCDNIWKIPSVFHRRHWPVPYSEVWEPYLFANRWRMEEIVMLPNVEIDPYPEDFTASNETPYLFEFKHSDATGRMFELSLVRIMADTHGCEGLTLDELRPGRRPVTLAVEKPGYHMSVMWLPDTHAPRRHIPREPSDLSMVYVRDEAKRRLLENLLEKPEYTERISAFLQAHWPELTRSSEMTGNDLHDTRSDCHNADRVIAVEKQTQSRSCAHAVTSLSRFLWDSVVDTASRVMHGR